jgi:predicted transcriptional regulator
MLRTQIQVDEKLYDKLRQLALKEQRSMADCIREGIEWVVRESASAEEGLATIAGKFEPQPGPDLKPHDRAFVEAIAGKQRRA